jgi:hypothetical protein
MATSRRCCAITGALPAVRPGRTSAAYRMHATHVRKRLQGSFLPTTEVEDARSISGGLDGIRVDLTRTDDLITFSLLKDQLLSKPGVVAKASMGTQRHTR